MDASRGAGQVGEGPLSGLAAARLAALATLDRSRAVAAALASTERRLAEMRERLPAVEAAVRPARAPRDALAAVGGHIDRAVGPAAAVLKVFDAVHGLEPPLLSGPGPDPAGYLSLLQRLDEAVRFLSDNCGLAVQWLDDIVDYLDDNSVADPRFVAALKAALASLRQAAGPLDGGLTAAATDKLEAHFRRLMEDETAAQAEARPVLDRLAAAGRLQRCVQAFAEARAAAVQAELAALGASKYLDLAPAEAADARRLEGYIAQWGAHLEFAVRRLLEAEHRRCGEVFPSAQLQAECFAETAKRAGILAFLRFGRTVADTAKDPIKLLKLLDIFAGLNRLRLDFNRLFGGKPCEEIQSATRDLVKRVVDGASEIFFELLPQVELQREAAPPADGGVPRLVTFVADFCNRLLGDEHRPVLTQVLAIHRSWQKRRFLDRHLAEAIVDVVRAVELNLQSWADRYDDPALASVFRMNAHGHLCAQLRGTKLGDLLGETWLKEQERRREAAAAAYLKETWARLPPLLSREGIILFSGGRAAARELVKKRLRAFNAALEELLRRHAAWVVPDGELRQRACQAAALAVVPVYRSYMQNYGPLVEQEASAGKYAKYSVQSLEDLLGALFQPRHSAAGASSGRFKLRPSDHGRNLAAELSAAASPPPTS
ncbi:exocyst subunit exo70 family protein G1 [Wolffia australiana]